MDSEILKRLQQTRIIDNRKLVLNEVVQALLSKASRAKFAVGFLFSSGFKTIHGSYEHLESLQIIMGPKTDVPTKDFLTSAHVVKEQAKEELQKIEPEELEGLYNMIRQGRATFRIYLKEGAYFHSKLYLFTYLEGIIGSTAIFGSGNFSESGLIRNVELNTYFFEPDIVKKFDDWFDEIWGEAHPFDPTLLEAIQEIYQTKTGKRLQESAEEVYSPFDSYLLTLYKLYQNEIEQGTFFLKREQKLLLTEWQQDAVNGLLSILNEYPVAVLADTVGLGKTRVGIQVAKDFIDRGKKVLFVAPAVLISGRGSYWRSEASSFGITKDFMGLSSEAMGQERSNPRDFRGIDLIVIDEAHYFRNRDTDRYRFLESLKQLNPKARVLCITATPVNNSVFDLYNLLYLFLPDDVFRKLNITSVRRVFDDFRKGDKRAEQRLREILNEVAIKRTREFVKTNYKNAEISGTLVRFPDRKLRTVSYSLEEVYPGIFDRLLELMGKLEFPQFRLLEYSKTPNPLEVASGVFTSQLAKLTLLKRLESSVTAFSKSVENQISKLERLKNLAGRAVEGHTLEEDLEEDALAYLTDRLIETLRKVMAKPSEYDLNEFVEDAVREIAALKKVRSALEFSGDKDPKAEALLRVIAQSRQQNKKVLVFTSYIDTAKYLFERIQARETGIAALLTSQSAQIETKASELTVVINRFAPRANNALGIAPAEDIGTLVCTDLLSEGLNLQDASVVVSYDLPWNPMKLLQREGRIDRLGSTNPRAEIYNFIPEEGFERLLTAVANVQAGLRGTLQGKLSQVAKTFGKEFEILEEGEAIQVRDFVSVINRVKAGDAGAIDELESNVVGTSVFDIYKLELRNLLHGSADSPLLERAKLLAERSVITSSFRKRQGIYYLYEIGDELIPLYYDAVSDKIVDDWETILPLLKASENERPDGSATVDESTKRKIETEIKRRRQDLLLGTPASMYGTYLRTIISRLNLIANDPSLKSAERTKAANAAIALNRRFPGFIERKLRSLFVEVKNERSSAFLAAINRFIDDNRLQELAPADYTKKDVTVKLYAMVKMEQQESLVFQEPKGAIPGGRQQGRMTDTLFQETARRLSEITRGRLARWTPENRSHEELLFETEDRESPNENS